MRRRRALIVLLIVLALLAAAAVVGVRWLLGPENLARLLTGWVERELGATLTLKESPGVRLIPRLQLSLDGVRVERRGVLLASVEELNVALPWSSLWRGGLNVESLHLRRPTIAWPELSTLWRELGDDDAQRRAPTLPGIAVGLRVEDGILLSGPGDDAWRVDNIALVTTPLSDGEPFHLDAGARVRGTEARALSLTLQVRPQETADGVNLDDIAARLVVSPDGRPLDASAAMQLSGRMALHDSGPALAELTGALPGWPDWLPNLLGFDTQAPVTLTVRYPDDAGALSLALGQDGGALTARLQAADFAPALAQIDRPLAAIAAVRGRWQLDALRAGGLSVQGLQLEVEPVPFEPPAE